MWGAFGITALVYPWIVGSSYAVHMGIVILMYAILSMGFDILARTGQVSVGQAALFGLGAYCAVLTFEKFGIDPVLAIFLGGLFAGVVAAGFGFATLRIRGIYFSIATICFAESLQVLALMARGLTGGAIGVSVPPIFDGNITASYYFILALLGGTILVSLIIDKSKLNFAFTAIRENEKVASVMGINPTKYKVLSFVLSAFFTGCVGGFYAFYITYIIPYEVFGIGISVACLVMPVFGGLYTIEGPLLGAVVLKTVEEFLRTTIPYGHMIVYGVILVVSVLYMPAGIVGLVKKRFLERE
ncbi:MAG: branched-chain amino acid ABC transporter permease [Synergistetes bacterium]|nr:branched-chain amino acid ABC transporter permease [Synergistota bacterium]